MCNCNSDWVQNARNIYNQLQQQTNLSQEELVKLYTLEFLLTNNYCGIDNRTSIKDIINHLSSRGISLSREDFQQKVLTDLKRAGAIASLIYPGKSGGIFIPCDISDMEKVISQVLDRIDSELNNILGLTNIQNCQRIRTINSFLSNLLQNLRQGRLNNHI